MIRCFRSCAYLPWIIVGSAWKVRSFYSPSLPIVGRSRFSFPPSNCAWRETFISFQTIVGSCLEARGAGKTLTPWWWGCRRKIITHCALHANSCSLLDGWKCEALSSSSSTHIINEPERRKVQRWLSSSATAHYNVKRGVGWGGEIQKWRISRRVIR